jgi:hypothetical protein
LSSRLSRTDYLLFTGIYWQWYIAPLAELWAQVGDGMRRVNRIAKSLRRRGRAISSVVFESVLRRCIK